MIEFTLSPRKAEMILGGASCPPNLISLPGTEQAEKNRALLFFKAARVTRIKSLNNSLSSSFYGIANKFLIFPLSLA